MTEDALRIELEQLRGQIAANNTAMQAGFGELRRQINALFARADKQSDHCGPCRDGLQAEIQRVEREARTLVKAAADEVLRRVEPRLEDHEKRLRATERFQLKWAGASAAIGALSAVAGKFILEALI